MNGWKIRDIEWGMDVTYVTITVPTEGRRTDQIRGAVRSTFNRARSALEKEMTSEG